MEERENKEAGQCYSHKELTFSRAFSSHELNPAKMPILTQEKVFRRSSQSLKSDCFTLEEEDEEGTHETQVKRKKDEKKDSGNVKRGSKIYFLCKYLFISVMDTLKKAELLFGR